METVGVGATVGVAVGGTGVGGSVGAEVGAAFDETHPAKNRKITITRMICGRNFALFILAPSTTTIYTRPTKRLAMAQISRSEVSQVILTEVGFY
jgi:hypothetical protein